MKKLNIILCILVMSLLVPLKVQASTGSISASSATVNQGDSVTVVVTLKGSEAIGAYEFYLKYDQTILEYVSGANGGGAGRLKFVSSADSQTVSCKVTFKAINTGKSSLSVVDHVLYNLNTASGDVMTSTASGGSVTVKAQVTSSTVNTLSSITVGQGTISPAFSANTTSYTMNVGNSVTSLTINASPTDSKAKVAISGHQSLKEGDNTVSITVTAENGDKKVYKILVHREATSGNQQEATEKPVETVQPTLAPTVTPEETPEVTPEPTPEMESVIEINGESLGIQSDFSKVTVPEDFKPSTFSYHGEEIPVLVGTETGIILVYLSNDTLYMLNEEDLSFVSFEYITIQDRDYILYPLAEELTLGSYYGKANRMIDEQELEVWIHDETSEFYLFYAMNMNGDLNLYQYDSVEQSVQRFNSPLFTSLSSTVEETTSPNESESVKLSPTQIVMWVILGCIVIVVAILCYVIMTGRRKNRILRELEEMELDLYDPEEDEID